MLCDYVWLCACWLFELTIGCLFAFALNVFTLLVRSEERRVGKECGD